jgi:ketosteroid isomerase-like protein
MSQQNVELARRMLDAWNRRDVETLRGLSAADVEYVNSPTAVEPGTRHGPDQGEEVAQAQWEMLLDARWEEDAIYDRGDEVIALGRVSRRMPDSETRIEDRSLLSFTINDGRAIRLQVLAFGATEVKETLKAAGLSE